MSYSIFYYWIFLGHIHDAPDTCNMVRTIRSGRMDLKFVYPLNIKIIIIHYYNLCNKNCRKKNILQGYSGKLVSQICNVLQFVIPCLYIMGCSQYGIRWTTPICKLLNIWKEWNYLELSVVILSLSLVIIGSFHKCALYVLRCGHFISVLSITG